MKRELFADAKKYGWIGTRTAEVPTPRRRHKRHRSGAYGLPWEAGKYYRVNITVGYDGDFYTCISAHTSQAGQTPDGLPLLWSVIP